MATVPSGSCHLGLSSVNTKLKHTNDQTKLSLLPSVDGFNVVDKNGLWSCIAPILPFCFCGPSQLATGERRMNMSSSWGLYLGIK